MKCAVQKPPNPPPLPRDSPERKNKLPPWDPLLILPVVLSNDVGGLVGDIQNLSVVGNVTVQGGQRVNQSLQESDGVGGLRCNVHCELISGGLCLLARISLTDLDTVGNVSVCDSVVIQQAAGEDVGSLVGNVH